MSPRQRQTVCCCWIMSDLGMHGHYEHASQARVAPARRQGRCIYHNRQRVHADMICKFKAQLSSHTHDARVGGWVTSILCWANQPLASVGLPIHCAAGDHAAVRPIAARPCRRAVRTGPPLRRRGATCSSTPLRQNRTSSCRATWLLRMQGDPRRRCILRSQLACSGRQQP